MANPQNKNSQLDTAKAFIAGMPTFASSDSWEEDMDTYFRKHKESLVSMAAPVTE